MACRGQRFRTTAMLGLVLTMVSVSTADAAPTQIASDAQTRSAARELATRAIELMQNEQWAQAQDLLQRAYALVPAPTIATLEGISLEQMGRLVEAADRYEVARVTPVQRTHSAAFARAVERAEERLAALRPRIPRLSVVLDEARTSYEMVMVTLDERPVQPELLGAHVSQPVDPGRHVVRASFQGRPVAEQTIDIAERESHRVVLDVGGISSGSSLRRTLGWTSLGIGASGLATGLVAGAFMMNHKSTLDASCSPSCPEDLRGEHEAFRRARTISFIGYGVGIAGVALGSALLLSDLGGAEPKQTVRQQPRARIEPWVGLDAAGVRGSF